MRFQIFDFLRLQGIRRRQSGEYAKTAILLVASGTPGDLADLGQRQPAPAMAVEFLQRGKGNVGDVEIEPHADGIGRDQIVDLAVLVHLDLRVAGLRRQRPHHDRRAAMLAPQHLGNRVDILDGEGDDRRAPGQSRQFARPRIAEGGKARPGDDLGIGQQRLDQRPQAFRTQDHGFVAPPGMQHAIGEYMAALGVDADLRLVDRDEGKFAVHRHRFGGAQEPLRILRDNLFLAGDQRHPVGPLQRHHPVIDFPGQQPQRKTDHAAGMSAHPFDGKMGFAGIGRAENGD